MMRRCFSKGGGSACGRPSVKGASNVQHIDSKAYQDNFPAAWLCLCTCALALMQRLSCFHAGLAV